LLIRREGEDVRAAAIKAAAEIEQFVIGRYAVSTSNSRALLIAGLLSPLRAIHHNVHFD
jgi:hypothetical protein